MKLEPLFLCFEHKASSKNNVEDKTEKPHSEKNNVNQVFQILVAFNVGLLNMGFGAVDAWTSPALPFLQSPASKLQVSSNEGSWIVSIYNFGAIFGYLLCPILADRYGRKFALLFFSFPQIISWILILVAKHVIVLYVARFLGGLSSWAIFHITIVYLGEIANENIRGTLLNIELVTFNFGALVCITSGAFVSYNTMNSIMLLFPLIFLITFKFLPESPYFYVKQQKESKAVQSLLKLQGEKGDKDLKIEINRIKSVIIADEKCKKNALRNIFKDKKMRKAFYIVLLLKVGYVFSGSAPVAAYYQEILSYSDFGLSAEYSTIVLQSVIFIFSIVAAPLADYMGRKKLNMGAGIICALSLSVLGTFFFLKFYLKMNVSSISWIPLVSLIIFNLSCCLGVFIIPSILASEVFPMEIKNIALCAINIIETFLLFLVKLGFKSSATLFGFYTVFWTFALSCFSLSLISFFIMPETKGKTLEQVQMLLS